MNQYTIDEGECLRVFPNETVRSAELFLKRLRRLLVLRYQASHYLDETDVRLLDRCVYTTFCDCIELGAEETAKQLLNEARSSRSLCGTR